jgi:CheY-like chemotaxis protein
MRTQTRASKKPNILMVEDNLVAQKVEQAMFEDLNCKVNVAASGKQALALFLPGKYDLVLMDIGLADTTGYIVAKKIREMEKVTPHHVPIIALTAYKADVVKYDCADYTMEGVITKPILFEQVSKIISRFVFKKDIEVDGLYF